MHTFICEYIVEKYAVNIPVNQLVSTFVKFSFERQGVGQKENYVNLAFVRHRSFDLPRSIGSNS
jgi:hypothetical protein